MPCLISTRGRQTRSSDTTSAACPPDGRRRFGLGGHRHGEPERRSCTETILTGPTRRASAATLLETSLVVLARKGEAGFAELRAFIDSIKIKIVSYTAEQLAIAVDAFRRFGKGRHPAALNLGDCFSYASAKAADEPLLFKVDDFPRTDIKPAM